MDNTKLMKTLSRDLVLDMSPFLKVEKHKVGLPDGKIIEDWPWLITPDFANVVVITPENKFLIFRQAKYSVQGSTLAPVGGYIEKGEEPLAAAKRELLEEAGYKAPHWENLGQFAVDGNRGNGVAYFFLARDAYPVTEPDADDLEEQEMLFLSRAELEAAVARGAFKVLPWQTIMALALLRA
ncbi:MAG: NUDIX hydrolase [Brevefilum sp.]|nr:NUDIX hydrolase [Brevefilum sp.]MDW7755397.1 NUDIX hydrolase [Brevefilum sp.]